MQMLQDVIEIANFLSNLQNLKILRTMMLRTTTFFENNISANFEKFKILNCL